MSGSEKNVFPYSPIEWSDKEMGSSYHIFASNTSFSFYGPAVNSLQLGLGSFRLIYMTADHFYIHIGEDKDSFVTNHTLPSYMAIH
jgi:hypothetical protein